MLDAKALSILSSIFISKINTFQTSKVKHTRSDYCVISTSNHKSCSVSRGMWYMGNSVQIFRDFWPKYNLLVSNMTLEPEGHLLKGIIICNRKHLQAYLCPLIDALTTSLVFSFFRAGCLPISIYAGGRKYSTFNCRPH